jgi:hypothetical protein
MLRLSELASAKRQWRKLPIHPAGLLTVSFFVAGALSDGITVERNEAIPDYPESIEFHLSATSDTQIESVELEFGTDALTCGDSVTRAIPEDFVPGTSVEVEWNWNLRRAGSMPPGTMVWWRWVLTDAAGQVEVTDERSLRFIDDEHDWQTLESDGLSLYWYEGTTEFAQALVEAGEESLETIHQVTGIDVDQGVQVYVYANSEDVQAATLFAPAWSGGLAYPDHSTVMMGIGPDELGWGRRSLAHELAHVVVGHFTFSCLESTPRWLDEGLAMYAEGEPRSYHTKMLENAIEEDTLLSVRALGEIFSEDSDYAILSYAQSKSLVEFLIEQHGRTEMLQLLDEFKAGTPEDAALMAVYGLDRDGLEAAWREWVGAAPMSASEPVLEPTQVPTLAPLSGPAVAPTLADRTASNDEPPSTAAETNRGPDRDPYRLFATIAAGVALSCTVIALVGAVVWLTVRRQAKS